MTASLIDSYPLSPLHNLQPFLSYHRYRSKEDDHQKIELQSNKETEVKHKDRAGISYRDNITSYMAFFSRKQISVFKNYCVTSVINNTAIHSVLYRVCSHKQEDSANDEHVCGRRLRSGAGGVCVEMCMGL